MRTRKNQRQLGPAEWKLFIGAIDALHGPSVAAPRYRDFVKLHIRAMTTAAGMAWEVHTMPGMGMVGRNFLAWHRRFLSVFETRLQKFDANVTIPYWDPTVDPQIPPSLADPALLERWSVERGTFDASQLPQPAEVNAVKTSTSFVGFQRALEGLHSGVHNAVGGDMGGAASPTDPLFWLHHANIDRIWAEWQRTPAAQAPAPGKLQPAPLMDVTIESELDITTLGYAYGP